MPDHELPNPLRELQPLQRIVWHEIGQELREHYGDAEIRDTLTRLSGSIEEKTIALEAGAVAAIKCGVGCRYASLRRYEVTERGSHVSVGRSVAVIHKKSINHLPWL